MLVVKLELVDIAVKDTEGGVWRPSEEARAEIEAAEDPERRAVEICEFQPMRGTWKS